MEITRLPTASLGVRALDQGRVTLAAMLVGEMMGTLCVNAPLTTAALPFVQRRDPLRSRDRVRDAVRRGPCPQRRGDASDCCGGLVEL